MAKVVLTTNLRKYTGGVTELDAPGDTVRDLLTNLERTLPGLRAYLINDAGAIRQHVNIFIDGEAATDRAGLSDSLRADATVHILQALSGG